MRTFAYSYVDHAEATPRTVHSDVIRAEDADAAEFRAWFLLFDDGSNCQVFDVFEIEI